MLLADSNANVHTQAKKVSGCANEHERKIYSEKIKQIKIVVWIELPFFEVKWIHVRVRKKRQLNEMKMEAVSRLA